MSKLLHGDLYLSSSTFARKLQEPGEDFPTYCKRSSTASRGLRLAYENLTARGEKKLM